jgi:Mg2+ and Co2+ transporter CorA
LLNTPNQIIIDDFTNETNQYFNRISELDSHATANIAAETRRDAVSMRTIAFVTLIFLPGTFVSSFFSMAFFQGSGPIGASKLWMYVNTQPYLEIYN